MCAKTYMPLLKIKAWGDGYYNHEIKIPCLGILTLHSIMPPPSNVCYLKMWERWYWMPYAQYTTMIKYFYTLRPLIWTRVNTSLCVSYVACFIVSHVNEALYLRFSFIIELHVKGLNRTDRSNRELECSNLRRILLKRCEQYYLSFA